MEKVKKEDILEMRDMKKKLNNMVIGKEDYNEIYRISTKLDKLIMAYYDKKLGKRV